MEPCPLSGRLWVVFGCHRPPLLAFYFFVISDSCDMETWWEAVEHAYLKAPGKLYIFQIYNFIMWGEWIEFLSSILSLWFGPCAPLDQRSKNGANKWKCGGKCHNIYQGLLHSHISAAHKLDYIWEINDLDSASFWLKSFFRKAEAFFRKYVCQANHLMKEIRKKWLTFHQKICFKPQNCPNKSI